MAPWNVRMSDWPREPKHLKRLITHFGRKVRVLFTRTDILNMRHRSMTRWLTVLVTAMFLTFSVSAYIFAAPHRSTTASLSPEVLQGEIDVTQNDVEHLRGEILELKQQMRDASVTQTTDLTILKDAYNKLLGGFIAFSALLILLQLWNLLRNTMLIPRKGENDKGATG